MLYYILEYNIIILKIILYYILEYNGLYSRI